MVKGSAQKRQRQNISRHMRNKMLKSTVKTTIKKYVDAVKASDKETAEASLKLVMKKLDGAVSKGIYHKNTAARKKSRMYKLYTTLAAAK